MWDAVTTVALILCCLLAVVMTAVRLPGTWLIVLCALGYAWWADWQRVGMWTILALGGIAVAGEVIELLTSVFTTRKAGGTRQAAWGGLIGGILGMFFLSFLVPVPLVGTMIGAVVGCFGGAALAEMAARRRLAQGTRVGLFSALGFVLGTATKIALALIMSGILLTSAVCSQGRRPAEGGQLAYELRAG